MAEPVSFAEANAMVAGPGAAPDEVLPCSLVARTANGGNVTCWKLSLFELAEIVRNDGKLWVMVPGAAQPEMVVSAYKGDVL